MKSMDQTTFDARAFLDVLLAQCLRDGASDIHLSPGIPPHMRVHGELKAVSAELLRPGETLALSQLLAEQTGAEYETFEERLRNKGSVDGALSSSDGTRFRFNIFKRQRQLVLVLRRLDDHFRSLAELGLSENLYSLCDLRDGLVIVCGPTGAGKSTTLATLIDRINQTRSSHIVTIEDPIEYVHASRKSIVNQRQIGIDAPTFNDALVSSLRQDPDVILLGEIRDVDTIRTAVVASETGHLVFTTLHAGDCVSAIERLISVFPTGEQEGIRRQLALVVKAIIAQHLVPTVPPVIKPASELNGHLQDLRASSVVLAKRPSRMAASEILMITPAVANLISMGKASQIYSLMETGQSFGMQTLEQDLARLWSGGQISEAVAVATARNVAVLRSRFAALRKRTPGTPEHRMEAAR